MKRLIYNNKAFIILNNFSATTNNSEVTFNDITIDFTGCTLADMPLKYQEVQIRECLDGEDIFTRGNVLFFGYVDTIELGKMQMSEEYRELTITLLSPLKLATVRTTTVKGTYKIKELIPLVLEPLINDGYTLKEMNVIDGQLTVNYLMQNIEYCMNDLGNKCNIMWTIDKNKNIYVYSIEYLFAQKPKKTIKNTSEENGLLKIQPQIESTDYANVINIRNARLFYTSIVNANITPTIFNNEFGILNLPKTVKADDIVEFNYPICVSLQYIQKIVEDRQIPVGVDVPIILMQIGDGLTYTEYSIYYNTTTKTLNYTGNFTFSDSGGNEGTIVLQRDSFFSNLITGFKWNGANNREITYIRSDTALRYTKIKFMHFSEIEKLKGIISQTGQIEKTVDAEAGWFTDKSLLEYARNLIVKNTNNINTIQLMYDYDYDFKLGDIIEIDLPSFYCVGKYAVTEIKIVEKSRKVMQWVLTLKKSNIIGSYIDLFRPFNNNADDESTDSLVISDYTEEGINEVHIVEEVEDEN